MEHRRRLVAAAAAAATCLLAAACGSDNSSSSSSSSSGATTAAASAGSTAAPSTSSGAAPPASTNGTAAGATTPVIPTGSNPNGYGQDDQNKALYHGPSGFDLDTSTCPGDWDASRGITDSEIRLFTALPLSGPIAQGGVYGLGMKSYFDYVNANGGIAGRKVLLDVNDNQYKPDLTKTITDEALNSGKYAASLGINGTPMNLAIWDSMNQECTPQLLTGAGSAEWGDVKGHPWTSGYSFTYVAESRLQAEWLKKEFANGATVATITINNDFGKQYLNGLKKAIEGTKIKIVDTELHDPAAPNIDNQFTTVAASNADVVIIESAGVYCTQALADWERGAWKPKMILPAGCIGSATFQPLINQGLTGNGAYVVQNFKEITDPSVADQPYVKAYFDFLPKVGMDPKNTQFALGWAFAWAGAEVLADAATYKGGLNRANIALAAHAIDQPLPLLIPGLTSKVDGMKDAYLIEGGQMAQYTATDPKAVGTWKPAGDLINFEGQLGTYDSLSASLKA